MGRGNSKAERKNFYESLLRISWLAPEVRRAVFKALGRSVRAYKAELSYGWAMAARHLIAEEKARLKKLGKKRPSEGLSLSDEAWLNVADRQGMTVEALKQRLYRSKPRKK
jgi:hypothetical protein